MAFPFYGVCFGMCLLCVGVLPEQVVAHEVGGMGGVVSKLLAKLGWHSLPIGRFDDTEEGTC